MDKKAKRTAYVLPIILLCITFLIGYASGVYIGIKNTHDHYNRQKIEQYKRVLETHGWR